MKHPLHRLVFAVLMLSFGASCTTAYDHRGRPRQVVEPGTALIGAAAVGLLAYGLANNNNRRYNRNDGYGGYRGGYSGYRGGYSGYRGSPRYSPGGFYGYR